MGLRAILFVGMLGVLAFWVFDSDSGHDRAGAKELTRDSAVEGKARGEAEQEQIAEPDAELAKSTEPAPRTVRWKILPGEFGVPADGTIVDLQPRFGREVADLPATGVVDRDWIVVVGWNLGRVSVRAFAPDGTVAPLKWKSGQLVTLPTKFTRATNVEVLIRDEHGAPVPGYFVRVGYGRGSLQAVQRTRANGRVVFEGVPRRFINLTCSVDNDVRKSEWIGCVDTWNLAGPVEHTLVPPIRVDMKLVGLAEGDSFSGSVSIDGTPIHASSLRVVDGRLVGEFRPPFGVRSVRLTLRGRRLRTCVDVRLPLPAPDGVWRDDLEFDPSGQHGVLRFDLASEDWTGAPMFIIQRVPKKRGEPSLSILLKSIRHKRRELSPGTYHLVEPGTHAVHGIAEIARGRVTTMLLGERPMSWQSCAVELPAGESWGDNEAAVRVHIRGQVGAGGPLFRGELKSVANDGNFGGSVNVGATFRVEARHPYLMPERSAFVKTAGAAVRIRLVAGPTARFQPPANLPNPDAVELRAPGRAPFRLTVWKDGGAWKFSGYVPGKYRLALKSSGVAAIATADVDLPATDTDLGVIQSPAGSTLSVSVLVAAPYSTPKLDVSLRRIEPPISGQERNDGRTGRTSFTNLAAGRYRLRVRCGPVNFTRVIELDGKTDIEFPIDLRHPDQR